MPVQFELSYTDKFTSQEIVAASDWLQLHVTCRQTSQLLIGCSKVAFVKTNVLTLHRTARRGNQTKRLQQRCPCEDRLTPQDCSPPRNPKIDRTCNGSRCTHRLKITCTQQQAMSGYSFKWDLRFGSCSSSSSCSSSCSSALFDSLWTECLIFNMPRAGYSWIIAIIILGVAVVLVLFFYFYFFLKRVIRSEMWKGLLYVYD